MNNKRKMKEKQKQQKNVLFNLYVII
jgi:hypothetical protein